MKLSEVKALLPGLSEVTFKLSDGRIVPEHFHVTEVGLIEKRFIDCGGAIRNEKKVNFQLWTAADFDHRLKPSKFLDIILLSEKQLSISDEEVEVEYQGETIGRYGLSFDGIAFILENTLTDCLAPDKCGIPQEKPRLKMSDLTANSVSCCNGKC